jgi:hypothetical protein
MRVGTSSKSWSSIRQRSWLFECGAEGVGEYKELYSALLLTIGLFFATEFNLCGDFRVATQVQIRLFLGSPCLSRNICFQHDDIS